MNYPRHESARLSRSGGAIVRFGSGGRRISSIPGQNNCEKPSTLFILITRAPASSGSRRDGGLGCRVFAPPREGYETDLSMPFYSFAGRDGAPRVTDQSQRIGVERSQNLNPEVDYVGHYEWQRLPAQVRKRYQHDWHLVKLIIPSLRQHAPNHKGSTIIDDLRKLGVNRGDLSRLQLSECIKADFWSSALRSHRQVGGQFVSTGWSFTERRICANHQHALIEAGSTSMSFLHSAASIIDFGGFIQGLKQRQRRMRSTLTISGGSLRSHKKDTNPPTELFAEALLDLGNPKRWSA